MNSTPSQLLAGAAYPGGGASPGSRRNVTLNGRAGRGAGMDSCPNMIFNKQERIGKKGEGRSSPSASLDDRSLIGNKAGSRPHANVPLNKRVSGTPRPKPTSTRSLEGRAVPEILCTIYANMS